MPMSMGVFKTEMMGTANWSFNMYPGLSLGAMNTIMQHASDDLKKRYMPPLTEGRWTGTMCLTEPQCGTDLGQVKTRAEPQRSEEHTSELQSLMRISYAVFCLK